MLDGVELDELRVELCVMVVICVETGGATVVELRVLKRVLELGVTVVT